MNSFIRTFSALFAVLFLGLAVAAAQPTVKDHYVKHEYMVPMRDGVKLFTAVYAPRDTTGVYPILLSRTPYSCRPYGEDNYPRSLRPRELSDYIFVYQDVRGRWYSEGKWVELRPINPNKKPGDTDESTDAYDTVEWLLHNISHNNGKVGITGISYPGFYTTLGTINAHPAVVATSPQAPIADDFIGDDDHHNGAFFLTAAFDFYVNFWRNQPNTPKREWFTHGTPDGYKFFLDMGPLTNADKYFKGEVQYWEDMMNHGTWDKYYQDLNVLPHLHDIKPSTMIVGGWFDAEDLWGTLHTYKEIEKRNPNTHNTLVMGPWYHGQWAGTGTNIGPIQWGSNTSEYYQQHIEAPFFEHYLKGIGTYNPPEAMVFLTGANEWRSFDHWPPREATEKRFYFADQGALSMVSSPQSSRTPYDEYVSDPDKPVPFTNEITTDFPREYMLEDQRFVSNRPDVLVYQTPVLENPVTIAGPLVAHLSVSTTGTDCDWVVKLIDVFPDTLSTPRSLRSEATLGGYQMMVRGEVMRGKFRNNYTNPEPFVPGKITTVEFELPDIFHQFKPGHRIMIQIQSSWFPLVDRNPGTFTDIYHARASDFRKTTQRVYHSYEHPSYLKVLTLKP